MAYDEASVSITAKADSNGIVIVEGALRFLEQRTIVALAQEAINSLYGMTGAAIVGKLLDEVQEDGEPVRMAFSIRNFTYTRQ